MAKTFEGIYGEYHNKFKNASLGADLTYDKDVVPIIIDLLKNLKNKLCVNDGNVSSEINSKFNTITSMQAIENSSTNSTFKVMNEDRINSSITKQNILDMPANIEASIGNLIQTLETENKMIEDYLTRCETAAHIEEYRMFLSQNSGLESELFKLNNPNGETLDPEKQKELEHYQNIKKLVEDYDNPAILESIKNSKLVNRAINKKMAFSEAGQVRAKITTPTAQKVEIATPKVEKPVFSEQVNKVSSEPITTTDVKQEKIEPIKTKGQLKSTVTDKNTNTSTNKTSSNFINDQKDTIKRLNNVKKSSLATSVGSFAKSDNNVINTTKELLEKASDKVQDFTSDVKSNLSSSIKAIKDETIKPIISLSNSINGTESSSSQKFIPPIAGVSAATVAGLGTKMYVNKSEKDNKVDQEEDIVFIKDIEEETKQEEREALSKEDLLKVLENKI